MNKAETTENELWYWMTKMRIAKLGVDVGEEFFPSLQAEADAGEMPNMFDFTSPAEYKHDTLCYSKQAFCRGEDTDELRDLCASILDNDNIGFDDDKVEAYITSLRPEAEAAKAVQ